MFHSCGCLFGGGTVRMIYRELGKTGLKVSAISMGCAALCNDYAGNKVDPTEAIKLVEYALGCGINLFDTAPSYGDSESILMLVLNGYFDAYLCTKFEKGTTPMAGVVMGADILLGHNHVPIRHVDSVPMGASIYETHETVEAIARGLDVVQFPYNLLNQWHCFCFGRIGTIARSILLRGKLASMAEDAIRWAVFSGPDTCLIGFANKREIDFALEALEKGPIDWDEIVDPRKF